MTTEQTKQNTLKTVAQQLLHRIPAEQQADDGPIHLQLDMTEKDIATIFGITRAEATHALNELKLKGYIGMEGSTIILHDRTALERFIAS